MKHGISRRDVLRAATGAAVALAGTGLNARASPNAGAGLDAGAGLNARAGLDTRAVSDPSAALNTGAGVGRAGMRTIPRLKVGFALVSPATDVGWTHQHALGVAAVRQALGDAVQIDTVDNVFQPQDAERVFRSLASSGHQLIYGTSFSHGFATARVAPHFPNVAFDSCAGTKILPNLGAFEARYHEGTFLAGIAAAKVTTGKLGFVGGFPIPDIIGPANAFLLGAQSVRPAATCRMIFMDSWSDPGKEKAATLALAAQGCEAVYSMTDGPAAVQTAQAAGIWGVGYASDMRKFAPSRQLTSVTLDWSSIYVQDAKDVAAGVWKPQSRWLGLKDGVVRMAPYADTLTADVRAFLARSEAAISAGELQPFRGEIRDQSGAVRVRAGAAMNESEIRSINWLISGMSGRLAG